MTRCKRIAPVAREAGACPKMVNDAAFSIHSAKSRTRVNTFKVATRLV